MAVERLSFTSKTLERGPAIKKNFSPESGIMNLGEPTPKILGWQGGRPPRSDRFLTALVKGLPVFPRLMLQNINIIKKFKFSDMAYYLIICF